MKAWYPEYWAQTWYRNTFLVRRPHQIAQAVGHEREWNNLYDSGCNFTCLAMIVGVDPARLASALSLHDFFYADARFPARDLTGRSVGLVWDQNAPHNSRGSFALPHIWHPRLKRRTSVRVRFVGATATRCYKDGRALVAQARGKGRHVICGPEEHAYLVAGTSGNGFYLWDPDESEMRVEQMLEGRLTLQGLFREFADKDIEFWQYSCEFT